jgi:hypothetical protein
MVLLVAAIACGKAADSGTPQAKAPTGKEILADVAASKSLPPEHYASPTAGFDLTLPGVWAGHYRAQEVKDTTDGAHLGVLFRFLPDSGSRAPQETLMTLRVFSQRAWKAAIRPGSLPIGSVLAERGDDVFVLSLPRENPYPTGTAEALGYDRLLISIAQGGKQIELTPHAK